MRVQLFIAAAALALAAGCDRGDERAAPPASTAPAPGGTPSAPAGSTSGGATTTTTPANIGAPAAQEERKNGTNPVQGQVDPKQGEQHKDFQQRGDAAGPTSPDTKPKN